MNVVHFELNTILQIDVFKFNIGKTSKSKYGNIWNYRFQKWSPADFEIEKYMFLHFLVLNLVLGGSFGALQHWEGVGIMNLPLSSISGLNLPWKPTINRVHVRPQSDQM